jgi:hypothetical protein
MPDAVIDGARIDSDVAQPGTTTDIFSNRCIITGVADTVFLNFEFALLNPDGSVIKTLCLEDVQVESDIVTGLSYDPTRRQPLQCDPILLDEAELATITYQIPERDASAVFFGYKVWLDQNGEPDYPAIDADESPNNAVSFTVSYPVDAEPDPVSLGAVAVTGAVGWASTELL